MSQRELCRVADLNENQISLIERGKRENIETDSAKAIASVFGVTLDWLIGGIGGPPDASDVAISAGAAVARYRLRVS